MLSISGLNAGYNRKIVVHGINLEVPLGLHVILGANGSGKTTLFRAISGVLSKCEGTIEYNGNDLTKLSPVNRAKIISKVQSSHQIISGITGQMLCEMAMYSKHILWENVTNNDKASIQKIAEQIGSLDLLDKFVDEISTGELGLVKITAALCQDTPVMLLDEPTCSLDFNNTHEIMKIVKSISKDKIILASMHDPSLALMYADSIMIMKDGQIVDHFTIDEIDEKTIENKLRIIYPSIRITRINGSNVVQYGDN